MIKIIGLLKRDWPKLLLVTALFILGILAGGQLPQISPELAVKLKQEALQKFTEIAKLMRQVPPGIAFFVIWANNMGASLTAILTGIILPLIPLFFLMGNGLLVGLFQNMTAVETGLSAVKFYLSLAPHGIFELPAFFIAVYLGIRFGLIPYRLIYHYLNTKEHLPLFREFLKDAGYYGILITFLFLIAAVIEVSVSPLVFGLWQGR